MRVIVLGGAGEMGSQAVEVLAADPGVTSVTIADRNHVGAEALARRVRSTNTDVSALAVDATDHAALVAAVRDHDVCASALGPFHRFEGPAVRAAIEAGVDYASICDESDAAEAVFRDHSAAAAAAGVTVVTGLGASPGLSNLAVALMAEELDTVERVRIAVFQPTDAGGGEAVLRHMFHIMTGDIATWRDGGLRYVPACSERQFVELPRFGRLETWNMGHSEPFTLPRTFPGLDRVDFLIGFGPGSRPLVAAARLGLFSGRRRANGWVRLLTWLEDRFFAGQPPGIGALRVDAWGTLDGAPAHRLLGGIGEMRHVTGTCLAVGAQMLGRGELTARHGVFAPEGCLPPRPYLEALNAHGVDAWRDLEMTQAL